MLALPRSEIQKRFDQLEATKAKVRRRLEEKGEHDTQRNRFTDYVLRYNGEKGMTVPEIEATFNILVIAGSETNATAPSGMMYYLLKDPPTLAKLADEIRGSFKHEFEITIDNVGKIPYLSAVIDEGLRLCPPVPFGLPRLIPQGGATVCGYWLPGGVSIHQASDAKLRLSVFHFTPFP